MNSAAGSTVRALVSEPQSSHPKHYGKPHGAEQPDGGADAFGSNGMQHSSKQIHKKNSLSQGLVI